MISVEAIVQSRFPGLNQRRPLIARTLQTFLRYLFHEREFRQFSEQYPHIEGLDFVEQALDYFEFDFRVRDRELERIPVSGPVVIVANHPIGSLDGLALLKMVGKVRKDVKAMANELLYGVEPLRAQLLPVDNMGNRTPKENIAAIRHHLNQNGALIIFPAGEVSRLSSLGVRDGSWHTGFLRFARAAQAPILPVYVDGRNSVFFYALSLLAKPISTLWLIREMFKQATNEIDIRVGHPIYREQYDREDLALDAMAGLIKRHVYRLTKGRGMLGFESELEAVAHPENRQYLKREIEGCPLLGETQDGKRIYLYSYQSNSTVMREIGRLRELSFRAVKEGTGRRRDIDSYDHYYDHVLLWDERELEIAGAYRMVPSVRALREFPLEHSLYTQTLFDFRPEFSRYLDSGLELGRSFVQPSYWGKRSLDYLWYGIGAYLRAHPEIRYLFGPVSISHSYPDAAKEVLISFYSAHFGSEKGLVEAKNPYTLQSEWPNDAASSGDYLTQFAQLKSCLSDMGVTVPTLFKQYTELFDNGGVHFAAFNIDHQFSDCVDGFIVADIHKMKERKRLRYIGDTRGCNDSSGTPASRSDSSPFCGLA